MKALLTLFTALLLVGCSNGIDYHPNIDLLTEKMDSLLSTRFHDDEPGACIIAVHGDSIIYKKCIGLAVLDVKEEEMAEDDSVATPKRKKALKPITENTLFNLASVSKQFSAIALLYLQQEGDLSLRDEVTAYYPQFKSPKFKDITLAQLLSHTSGIPDTRPRTPEQWEQYKQHFDTPFESVEDYKKFNDFKESIRYMEVLDSLAFEPGTRFEYQNPTYQLVEGIVEKVTGEKFDTWMTEHVFKPAGMTNTYYFTPELKVKNMAHGYVPDGFTTLNGDRFNKSKRHSTLKNWVENDYGEASFFATKADGGIYTTPMDFVKWDYALQHNLVVKKRTLKKAHRAYIQTDIPRTCYGYGFYLEHWVDRPQKIYHTGDNGGFLIFEGRFPELDLFYLVFANRPDWEREYTIEEMDKIFMKAFNYQ